MKWDAAACARLLACQNDDDLRREFPGHNLGTLKRRRREAVHEPAPISRGDVLGKVAELLEKSGMDLSEIDRIEKVRIGGWDGFSKGPDGNPVITPLETAEIILVPTIAAGPEWPVLQPAPSPVFSPPLPRKRKKRSGWKTAVILPDPQIGYRRDIDALETLDPFHDESAMSTALAILTDAAPDLIVNLGDLLDFPEHSRWEIGPEFVQTTQPSIYRAQEFLCAQRAAAPNAEIRLFEGNHDARLPRHTIKNAMASLHLKREPAGWPVLSVPNLLKLDEFGVEYLSGYPAAVSWINDRLACMHGSKVRSNGSTAAGVIDDERVSVIFGHIHRIELQHKTRRTRNGGRSVLAASPGCLCRIDGAVPSTKGAVDLFGRVVPTVENWQQGVAVITYRDGDAPFSVELIPIHAEETLFRGQPV